MKKYLFPSFLLAVCLLLSCKDDSTENDILPEEPEVPEINCTISEIINSLGSTELYYNEQGAISSMIYNDFDMNCYYDEAISEYVCESLLVEQELKFTYTNEKLTSAERVPNGSGESLTLTIDYEGDLISKLLFNFTYEDETSLDEYRFQYNGNQVSKVENYSNYSTGGEMVLYGYDVFTYSGENIIKIESFSENPFKMERKPKRKMFSPTILIKRLAQSKEKSFEKSELEYVFNATYDERLNPFRGNIPFLLYSNSFELFYSKNNITSFEDIEKGSSDYIVTADYQYTFNDKDLPENINVTYDDNGETYKTSLSINYTCK